MDPQRQLDDDVLVDTVRRIDPPQALSWPRTAPPGDTIWMGAADQDGRVVSFISVWPQQRSSPGCAASQTADVKEEGQATGEVRVDEETLEVAVRRLGGRVYGTNQPAEHLALEQAVLAYRSA